MIRINHILIITLVALVLLACDSQFVYEENLQIEEAEWDRKEKAKFDFYISETEVPYNFYINFRHSGRYPYKNLYLFTKTQSPAGKIAIDTAQMILANKEGRWMGKGIGDIYDYQFRFKEGVAFPDTGKYHFEIEQAMRDEVIPYVTDIGIRIEKARNE